MKTRWIRAAIGGLLLVVAVVLLTAGAMREHKVYDPSSADFGVLTFERISDLDLVIDTTFGGVKRLEDKLITTYDRSEDRGKRSCPT